MMRARTSEGEEQAPGLRQASDRKCQARSDWNRKWKGRNLSTSAGGALAPQRRARKGRGRGPESGDAEGDNGGKGLEGQKEKG